MLLLDDRLSLSLMPDIDVALATLLFPFFNHVDTQMETLK